MFNWAKRQKLSERASQQKSASSKVTKYSTEVSSHKYQEKEYHVQVQNDVRKKINKFIYQPSSSSKQKLTEAFNHKFKQRLKYSRQKRSNCLKPESVPPIFPNFYLNQFCSICEQKRGNKQGVLFFANILKEMGLIQDVVSDRELVRALYFELLCPDLISIYSYIEICLGGRVHLKEAYNKISKQNGFNLNLRKAQKIIDQKLGSCLYQELKKNRVRRKN